MHAESVIGAVGDTPLIELPGIRPEGGARILVKWEGANPTGSMKDRMALAMVRGAEAEGRLDPGQRIVEYTGGSTGTSLAFVCAVEDRPLSLVTADCFSDEKIRTMRTFGADLTIHETPEGKIYPGIVDEFEAYVEEIQAETGAYFTHQMENPHQAGGYERMGEEILEACPEITDFVMGYGTAGCLTGNARVLQPEGVHMTTVEPAESPLLTEGSTGSHNMEGVSPGIVPPLLEDETYDDVVAIPQTDAAEMARRVAKTDGLFSGTSSGMNLAAAVDIAAERDPDDAVVTVACDTGLKYLHGLPFGEHE